MSDVEDLGAESLNESELAAVVRVVRALIDHHESFLRDIGAYEKGDPYSETQPWRLWDHVDLVMPRGDPREWKMNVFRGQDPPGFALEIEMWTEQEGRSDLTLEIEMTTDAERITWVNLHVM